MKGKKEDLKNTLANDDHYLQNTDTERRGPDNLCSVILGYTHKHTGTSFFLRTQSEILAALAGYRLECRSK